MHVVPSKDGTPIACQRLGSGPPLVLIHGTGASSARWKPVVAELGKRFTVYGMDRRGHGASGDSPDYSMDKDAEDVVAVLESLGPSVDVIAHSFGGICTLEASLLTRSLRRLILYEPPIPVPGQGVYTAKDLEHLESLAAKGDREGILAAFFLHYVKLTPSDLDVLRAAPAWPARLKAAHTIPRELRVHQGYDFRGGRFANVRVPTLILSGGDSHPFYKAAVDLVHRSLPDSRVAVLPGQRHVAMDTAPQLFLQEVLAFLAPTQGESA